MKNLIYTTFFALLIFGCSKDNGMLPLPSNISDAKAEPRVGGALVKWDIPADSSFTYVEVHYLKNGKEVLEKSSKYTDTLLIKGLINKEEFSFQLQTVNETPDAIALGEMLTTDAVRPIRRSPEITYFQDELEKLTVTADILDTYTQESSEGPKENLVDGDPNTYWHSAWSSGVAPLPHWIQINFAVPTELGAITYWFRQNNGDQSGRPQQWGLEVSDDGTNWTTVWESQDNLPVSDNSTEQKVIMDKNYTSKYFRVMILKDGSGTYAHLGEISFYKMDSKIEDKEKEAEEEYYSY